MHEVQRCSSGLSFFTNGTADTNTLRSDLYNLYVYYQMEAGKTRQQPLQVVIRDLSGYNIHIKDEEVVAFVPTENVVTH